MASLYFQIHLKEFVLWIAHAINKKQDKKAAANAVILWKNAIVLVFPPPPAPRPVAPRKPQRKENNSLKLTSALTLFLIALPPLHAESDPLKSVAAGLAKEIRKQGPINVAVLGLVHHDNHFSDGPGILSDRLASWLSTEKKIAVVERDRLEQALDELRLGQTGTMDPQTVKSLGTAVGADVIITGTIINLPHEKCEVNARALWANNGRVLAAARAVVDRTWKDRKRLSGTLDSSRDFESGDLKSSAVKLNSAMPKKPSLAVLNFPYSRNRSSTGSHLVSERLVTYLAQHGASVVERRLLGKLLEERKLWETGLMSADAMKNVGGILSVDAVVTGFLTDISETATQVLVRVVQVDTGEIISSASETIDRIWSDAPRLPVSVQPRSAVPVAFVPMPSYAPQTTGASAGKVTILQQAGRSKARHRRYYPAAIPVLMPKSQSGRPTK